MKRQILPLLLCLFTTVSVMSFSTQSDINNTQQFDFYNDFQSFNFNQNYFSILNSKRIFNDNFGNFSLKNQEVFNYFSNKMGSGGISLNEEFSYYFINNSALSASLNLSPINFQGNLFNQGLFYGFALTVLLMNIVCFFVFDEKQFIMFAATVAALTVAFFFAEGLFPLIGIDGIFQTQLMQSTLLLFAVGLSALFAQKFLSVKEFYPKLPHITVPLFGISILLVVLSWIKADSFISSISNIVLFGVLSLYFLTGVLLFSKKNYVKFYVIATFIPLLFSIDFFVLKPFGIDFLFTETMHLKVATLFEVLLLSYAIMYRMQAVKEEDELRQTEMRIFLKRQDVMSRAQVERMVEDVYLENLIMQYDLDGLEIKLLQYISEGKTNTKIAKKLKLSEDEVIEYTKELYQKLEISDHIQEDYRMVESQPDYLYN